MSTLLRAASLLLLFASPAIAGTQNITNSGFTFSPANVTISVGDTVCWNWTSGIHTVTNGNGSADPNVGVLFDATWDSANPTFSYTFNTAGSFPYFCRTHEFLGMSGTITVLPPVPATSPASIALMIGMVLLAGVVVMRVARRRQSLAT